MKTYHKDSGVAALIIFAIVLFISGEYTVSTGLFTLVIIALNIKSSPKRFKADLLSWH